MLQMTLSCEGGKLGLCLVRFTFSDAIRQLDGYDVQELEVLVFKELLDLVQPLQLHL